jgi:hypothetical protein
MYQPNLLTEEVLINHIVQDATPPLTRCVTSNLSSQTSLESTDT